MDKEQKQTPDYLEGLNNIQKSQLELVSNLSWCLDLPLVEIEQNGFNLNPLTRIFGREVKDFVEKQGRNKALYKKVDLGGIFNAFEKGLKAKTALTGNNNLVNVNAIEFYKDMAGLIGENIFGGEKEITSIMKLAEGAIKGFNSKDFLEHINDLNHKTMILIKKRIVLQKVKKALEKEKRYDELVEKLDDLKLVYPAEKVNLQNKKDKREEKVWLLRHIIIPIKNALDNDFVYKNRGLRLTDFWQNIAENDPYSKKKKECREKQVDRTGQKHTAKVGPGRYSNN